MRARSKRVYAKKPSPARRKGGPLNRFLPREDPGPHRKWWRTRIRYTRMSPGRIAATGTAIDPTTDTTITMIASHHAQLRRFRSPEPTAIQTIPKISTRAPRMLPVNPKPSGRPTPTRRDENAITTIPRRSRRTPPRIVRTAKTVTPIGRDGVGAVGYAGYAATEMPFGRGDYGITRLPRDSQFR